MGNNGPMSASTKEAIAAGKARAHERRKEQARVLLGPDATEEALELQAIEFGRAERKATRARKKVAKAFAATTQTPSAPPPPAKTQQPPSARADIEITEARAGLMGHAIFGGSVLPGAALVSFERMLSADPLHKLNSGIGHLETIPIESFGYDYVRSRYGGGTFKASALSTNGRVIATSTFQIAGRALQPEEVISSPETPQTNPWLVQRLEHLEAQAPSREDVIETRFERQRLADEARQQNIMAQLREETRSREAETRARAEAEARARQDDKNMTLQFFQLLASQQEQSTQRLIAAMTQKPDDGSGVLMKNMVAWMGGITGIYSTLLESVKDTMSDDAEKSLAQEIGGTLKRLAAPLAEEVLPAIGRKIAKKLDESSEPERKQLPPPKEEKREAMAFELPDGRVVGPTRVRSVLDRLKKELGKEPEEAVLVEALSKSQDEFEDHVRAERAKRAAPRAEVTQQPASPPSELEKPATEEKKWAAKDALYELRDAFRNQDEPLAFLQRALRFGIISQKARQEIATIYHEAKDGEGVAEVLAKVVKHASQRGVDVPRDLEDAFRSDILRAPKWLSEFLFGTTFQDQNQARAALDQRAKAQVQ